MPVNGELLAKFGNKRIDSLNWGLFIKANEGTEVRAVGAGRVMGVRMVAWLWQYDFGRSWR